jgi:tRNA threonylcarbamoyl adenosine modification protein YeaZ
VKYGLAIHTTSSELGLALSNFAENLSESSPSIEFFKKAASDSRSKVWDLGRSLSTHLHYHLAEYIQPQTWADLGFVAVAKGPGSFTSTRIGVVTARTIAQQLDIPLFAISSLEAIARTEKGDSAKAVQISAQTNLVYAAIYSDSTALLPDSLMTVEDWQKTLENWQTPYQLIKAEDGLGATVTNVLEIAGSQWLKGKRPQWIDALPFYGQSPVS